MCVEKKLYIKNMVSASCKMLVKTALDEMGISYKTIDLGEVEFEDSIDTAKLQLLKNRLLKWGLVVLDDHRAILVEQIKVTIIDMVHYRDEYPDLKHSVYISEKLHKNYTYLSNLFSEVKGIKLESFIIQHKIEKVKELILYNELSLTEIAYKLNYSSSAHLSNQFKKITGLTPSFFKKLKQKRLRPLEEL